MNEIELKWINDNRDKDKLNIVDNNSDTIWEIIKEITKHNKYVIVDETTKINELLLQKVQSLKEGDYIILKNLDQDNKILKQLIKYSNNLSILSWPISDKIMKIVLPNVKIIIVSNNKIDEKIKSLEISNNDGEIKNLKLKNIKNKEVENINDVEDIKSDKNIKNNNIDTPINNDIHNLDIQLNNTKSEIIKDKNKKEYENIKYYKHVTTNKWKSFIYDVKYTIFKITFEIKLWYLTKFK